MDQEKHQNDCQSKSLSGRCVSVLYNGLFIIIQMGKFSSDRAIQDYAQEYWNIESAKVE
jgi:glucan phosphorylase